MADFWTNRLVAAPELATYALRLSTATANTVTSERSFSALKMIQTRLRNRLTLSQLDKLIFVWFNSRVNSQEGPRSTGKRKRLEDMDVDDDDDDDEGLSPEEQAAEAELMVEAMAELNEAVDKSCYNHSHSQEEEMAAAADDDGWCETDWISIAELLC